MRKVLVCGAAFAATCVSAVAVPGGAQATSPAPTPPASAPASPSAPPGGEPGTTPPEGAPTTGAPGSQEPTASGTSQPVEPDGETDGTVSAEAVMVTPELPRARTYAYGKDRAQRVDVYWRKTEPGAAPRPAVLILHGGYWLHGDKAGWKYFARRLTEEGFVVLSANYRLAPRAQWPAQRDDAMSALAFLKDNAVRWNLDPQRVAVVGASSGGHLATQLGTFGTGSAQVRGVVALSPVTSPSLAYHDGGKPTATPSQRKLRGAVTALLNCVPGVSADEECLAKLEDSNSASHASTGDAPMLLMHTAGDFVPISHSNALAGALTAAGVPATVKGLDGDMHASGLLAGEKTYPTILAWLKERLRPGS
ncbi:alpha/beta hydrolase [Actinomadura sp. 7K534]|uniref:alpha/beta hydrolase n=1 Tax=Actinomadura sp. 7K534 TaxID=2530366 RepID=UPI001FB7DACD|nr:alpha/beta hydrolase [Actinomadura sp. 7K534]